MGGFRLMCTDLTGPGNRREGTMSDHSDWHILVIDDEKDILDVMYSHPER